MPKNELMPPIGYEFFDDIRENGFYYVDKTGLVKELLENRAKVTLFTRPRRFGKTLNMSMLQNFFEIGRDPSLFDGLAISSEKEICEQYMGKHPVIFITLKGVDGLDFEDAKRGLWSVIEFEASKFDCLQDSGTLNDRDKEAMYDLSKGIGDLEGSLALMSKILYKEYGKKTIILIDEYDVPLDKAGQGGFYDEMIKLIRNFLSAALKTNEFLEFAVLTGCLRVAKESIFTGMNNLRVCSVLDKDFDEWFGFTGDEVRKLLEYYGKGDYLDVTKKWYDGYRFGDADVYCPWDVINWCAALRSDSESAPKNYWANSSGNDIIIKFAEIARGKTVEELEQLSDGMPVRKKIVEELTYRELYESIDNIWSMLLNTGYLTCRKKNPDGTCELSIPNREIMNLCQDMLERWFIKRVTAGDRLAPLYRAFDDGDAKAAEEELRRCLMQSISFLDGGNTPEMKESFYHGLLIGLFDGCDDWYSRSNRETGAGRADIAVRDDSAGVGFIVEVKYAKSVDELDGRADAALMQIEDKGYGEYFDEYDRDSIKTVYKYGIAFCKKKCRVKKGIN